MTWLHQLIAALLRTLEDMLRVWLNVRQMTRNWQRLEQQEREWQARMEGVPWTTEWVRKHTAQA